MLKLDEIKTFFPDSLHAYGRFMLREYLQYKILEIVYNSVYANSLCLMGGTCLRIVHGNRRFSEDLDFDNIGMTENEFDEISGNVQTQMEREGYTTEIKTVMRGAWHCHIRFPKLLYQEGISGHTEEKILIQLDTEPQDFDYEPERIIINRFEVFTTILTTPLSLLLAQKLYTIMSRARNKGRDFYDVVFMMGKGVTPEWAYLDQKAGISDSLRLVDSILDICSEIDMSAMAADVDPFLFERQAREKVLHFPEYFKQFFKK